MQQFIATYGYLAIFVLMLAESACIPVPSELPVVRTFISLPAGIAGMPPVRFGVYTTLGCLPWTTALAVAGYAVGANWESIVNAFHGPSYVIAAVVLAAVVIGVWRYLRRRQAEQPPRGAHRVSGR